MSFLYSIVIPIHNEEGNIEELIERLYKVIHNSADYEVIFVDDASTDNSLKVLKKFAGAYLHIISLKKRFGQSGALYIGLKRASAPVIITMDGDLQNPPEEITKLLEKFKEGYDFVIGIRAKRKDSVIKKISSKFANFFRRLLLRDKFVDIGCSLRVFKKELVDYIFPFKSLHRFLPFLALMNNFKIAQVDIEHSPRKYGKTKYGVWKRLYDGLQDISGMNWLKKRGIHYKELFDESNIEYI